MIVWILLGFVLGLIASKIVSTRLPGHSRRDDPGDIGALLLGKEPSSTSCSV
jgi:uncharacterized membrane protein YeaQ/YmgE (transglycosylase-associated protein family)